MRNFCQNDNLCKKLLHIYAILLLKTRNFMLKNIKTDG